MVDLKLIGKRIQELRQKRGLTQSEFAEIFQISSQAVSNWERGISLPDVENLICIASYFDVLVDELLRMRTEDLYLGIDGGGTKTEFAVITSGGHVLQRLSKEGCNPNDVGFEEMTRIILEGMSALLVKYPSVKHLFCGVAGIATGDYGERLYHAIKKNFPFLNVKTKNDAFNLFAMDDRAKMAVISGTGGVVLVQTEEGYERIGGWGQLLSSSGSAYDVGRAALATVLREEDMKEPPSLLRKLLLERFGTARIWDHVSAIYKNGKSYIASLASSVFEAYAGGDPNAVAIIDESAKELATWLNAGVRLYGVAPIAVASGGLFEHYEEILVSHIKKYSSVSLIVSELPPIYGACRMARTLGGGDIPDRFYENFKASYQEAEA